MSGRRVKARQVEVVSCTIEKIMRSPWFARGVADRRAGRPLLDVDADHDDPTWSYERGRQWASIAPRSLRLRLKNGRLNPVAVKLFEDAGEVIR
jgi:hypothetical protein